MAFDEVQFPTDISRGAEVGGGYSTLLQTYPSGHETRVSRWAQPRHRYDASYAVKTFAELRSVVEFWHARQGRSRGFRWKDWLDFSTDDTWRGTAAWDDQDLGVFGTATDTIQLRKAYTSGGQTLYRPITKPVSGTVKVGWDHDGNGTPTEQSSGWTVDTTTGIITITDSSADGKTIFAGCQFDVPCRFGELSDEVFRVRLTGYELGDVPALPVVEIKDPVVTPPDFNYGGQKKHTADASMELRYRTHWTAQASGTINLTLPQPTNYYALGAPYFYVLHTGAGGSTVVKKYDGTTLTTLSNGEGCEVVLIIDGGTREFRVWG